MNVVIVGLGSIGSRHARLLAEAHDVSVVSRRPQCEYPQFASINSALASDDTDYVVIASPTEYHFEHLNELSQLGFGGLVLIEKPLFDDGRRIPPLNVIRAGVGYNLRFHPVIDKVRHTVLGAEGVQHAEFVVGQHIEDWRPGRDYRTTYSARLDRGGGVIRDLSHEIDLARYIFGELEVLDCNTGRRGSVEVDGPHEVIVRASASSCPDISITMNCLDRPARRSIRVDLGSESVSADLLTGRFDKSGSGASFSIDRDYTYRLLHEAVISGRDDRLATLWDGEAVMNIIEEVDSRIAETSR